MIQYFQAIVEFVAATDLKLTGERVIDMDQAWWRGCLVWIKTKDLAEAIWGQKEEMPR